MENNEEDVVVKKEPVDINQESHTHTGGDFSVCMRYICIFCGSRRDEKTGRNAFVYHTTHFAKLITHVETHHPKEPFRYSRTVSITCFHCNMSYSLTDFRKHMFIKHKGKFSAIVNINLCQNCHDHCNDRDQMVKHMIQMHNIPRMLAENNIISWVVCLLCGAKYSYGDTAVEGHLCHGAAEEMQKLEEEMFLPASDDKQMERQIVQSLELIELDDDGPTIADQDVAVPPTTPSKDNEESSQMETEDGSNEKDPLVDKNQASTVIPTPRKKDDDREITRSKIASVAENVPNQLQLVASGSKTQGPSALPANADKSKPNSAPVRKMVPSVKPKHKETTSVLPKTSTKDSTSTAQVTKALDKPTSVSIAEQPTQNQPGSSSQKEGPSSSTQRKKLVPSKKPTNKEVKSNVEQLVVETEVIQEPEVEPVEEEVEEKIRYRCGKEKCVEEFSSMQKMEKHLKSHLSKMCSICLTKLLGPVAIRIHRVVFSDHVGDIDYVPEEVEALKSMVIELSDVEAKENELKEKEEESKRRRFSSGEKVVKSKGKKARSKEKESKKKKKHGKQEEPNTPVIVTFDDGSQMLLSAEAISKVFSNFSLQLTRCDVG